MSKIGKQPINLPSGVSAIVENQLVVVNGSKGKMELSLFPGITVDVLNEQVIVSRNNDERQSKAFHGLIRSLIKNMVTGVSQGWSKNLELVGTGYRANLQGNNLTLNIGYSHPVVIQAPEGIEFKVDGQTKINVAGVDKHLVGQVADKIRAVRPPEPYKGKGIRYENEIIRRKAGKAAAGA